MKVATLSTAGVLAFVIGVVVAAGKDNSAPVPPSDAPRGLQTVDVPEPTNLDRFVADKKAAIQLGKALFWDMQIGSDSRTACATCHFQAGADPRSMNQMSPGGDRVFRFGPNYHLNAGIFPLRQLKNDPTDRGSSATQDIDDIVSSQGVFNTEFVSTEPGSPVEVVNRPFDTVFSVGTLNVRRVEPRHTPSVINAVFNHRNFWDGRAQNEFNGVNNWGDRDPGARVYRVGDGKDAPPEPVSLGSDPTVRLTNASLASQAVAPIMSTLEMAANGRDPANIGNKFAKFKGKKVASVRPLGLQLVHHEDSMLGPLSRWPKPGLDPISYEDLVRKAFRKEWWDSKYALRVNADDSVTPFAINDKTVLADNEFTLMQYNFNLFFGLALQLYEATLVSDDTPYDRWREGKGTISPEAFFGLQVFLSQNKPFIDQSGNLQPGTNEGARCINCHSGPAFTDASVMTISNPNPETGTVRRKRETQEIDRGFNNIGVRSTLEDLGVGALSKFGPLSATALCRQRGGVGTPESPCPPTSSTFLAVDGAFKVPALRNVELTAPYFHNGGHLTLESVVDFYSRGGDFGCKKTFTVPCGQFPGAQPIRAGDGTEIRPLGIPAFSSPTQGLTQAEKDGLIAFLKTLTDDRVRYRTAPFDHPQLFVPHGQLNDELTAEADPLLPPQSKDRVTEIPAVGKKGGDPIDGFLVFR